MTRELILENVIARLRMFYKISRRKALLLIKDLENSGDLESYFDFESGCTVYKPKNKNVKEQI
jgi:hypothetical protein